MAVAHVQERAEIGIGADGLLSLVPGQDPEFVSKVTLLQPLVILLNIPKVSFLYGDVEIAVFEVTLYSVFLNAFTNDVVPAPITQTSAICSPSNGAKSVTSLTEAA